MYIHVNTHVAYSTTRTTYVAKVQHVCSWISYSHYINIMNSWFYSVAMGGSSSSSDGVGGIIGGVVGGIIAVTVVIITVVVMYCCCVYKKKGTYVVTYGLTYMCIYSTVISQCY